jgi:hypothetical protein
MGMIKKYLLHLLHLCSDEQFGQDAVEWAIVSGHVRLTYNLHKDLLRIMGEPGKPETGLYPSIVEAYQREVRQNEELLVESYQPLLEELLRPLPLAMRHGTEAA